MLAMEELSDAGFEVIEASCADEALSVIKSKAEEIHVLFTDIHMPGSTNGLELAHHIRNNWPWIGVLIASGQANPSTEELPLGARFLRKPYDPAHAVKHIQELACQADRN